METVCKIEVYSSTQPELTFELAVSLIISLSILQE